MTDHIPIEDLSAYIDDALPPARRDLVGAHLATCADCQAEQASLAWAAGFALALPPADLPTGVSFGVPLISTPPPRPRLDRLRERRGRLVLAGLAAAVLVAALGIARLWTTSWPTRSDLAAGPGSEGPATGDAASTGAVPGVDVAADAESEPAAATLPLPGGQAAPPADRATTAALAAREPLDIDTAARVAGGLVKQGDSAEAQTRPLATALTADRSQRVLGEPRPGAAPPSTGVAARPAATSGTDSAPGAASVPGATAAPPIDRGGYAPPDAPIPGLSSARSGDRAVARASMTGTATVMLAAAGTGAGAEATDSPSAASAPGPAGGLEPPPPGTLTAWAATNTIDRADTAAGAARATGTAAGAAESTAGPAAATTALSVEARSGGAGTTPPLSTPASSTESGGSPGAGPAPDTPASAPRSLLVPLSALSIGLLALGILFLRQARARRRRRAWRQG